MRMMQRVNAAWDISKDEHSRAAYDRHQRGANTASGPDAWRRPSPGPSPGREWHRPTQPSSTACPRCNSVNERGSIHCYSCGLPFGEAQQHTQSRSYRPEYDEGAVSSIGRPGGFSVRLVACFIDVIIVLVAAIILVSFRGFSAYDLLTLRDFWSAENDWVRGLLLMFYFTVSVAAWSTTLGKRAFGLKVVRKDGSKIGIGRAFIRTLCYYISLLILGIGFLMIAFRRDKRGSHDLICDTKVVYR